MEGKVMLINAKERYDIVGAALEVHKILGPGFSEYVYQDALEIEFQERGIPYEREVRIVAEYKGIALKHDYFADFICYDDIIVECKAVESILIQHEAQLLNYLKASKYKVGLLINFGEMSLKQRVKLN